VYADRFKALISQAEVVQIAEAGHMVPYEQPEAFVSAVTQFLG
jgi:pimeloyl-ACP methyl ester carboxylesterase